CCKSSEINFHPDNSHLFHLGKRDDFFEETPMGRLRGINRQQDSVKIKFFDATFDYRGVLVACDTDESCESRFFGLYERFNRSFWTKYSLNIIVGSHVMHLPEIEIIRSHICESFPEMSLSSVL